MFVPIPVERAMKTFGGNLSLARRRRRYTQASLAERIGASLSTVRRMEQGDGRVPLVFYLRALHIFGELGSFEAVLDTTSDEIGLTLMNEQVPKRVRARRPATGAL